MNISTIPDIVWNELATMAIKNCPRNAGEDARFLQYMHHKFYRGLYSTASGGKYTSRTEEASVWTMFVDLFRKSDGKTLQEAFGPKKLPASVKTESVLNRGRAQLQISTGPDVAKNEIGARVYERYNSRPLAARFQFVVHSGGGIVLFNRMRRACQEYIHTELKGHCSSSVVSAWKVFGEEGQVGRSDSCVAYLADSIEGATLSALIPYVWQNIKDLVDMDFEAMGMTPIDNKPIWGFNVPPKDREIMLLGASSGGSAGGFMGRLLGQAYLSAIKDLAATKKPFAKAQLIDSAKAEADALLYLIYQIRKPASRARVSLVHMM